MILSIVRDYVNELNWNKRSFARSMGSNLLRCSKVTVYQYS